ncbi:uncharacterized protein LOC132062983 [Lycium ferocissimum]|uniref:uncharacterized protein LOC132062983 n=1 Tax=Lycium ferocissimum TaxID=112874 RepID=UPI002816227A|nr:uncharacterized protein LOC132062983 [Lycium ferocissimum]
MFNKLLSWKKKMDEFMLNLLSRNQVAYMHDSEGQPRGWVTRGIRLINWILLVLTFGFVALLTFWFFTSVLKLMGSARGSGRITAFNNNPWTDNDTLYTLSILTSSPETTDQNVKTPVKQIEYVKETDELHIVSLASTEITAGYRTRPKLHCALPYDDETTCHPLQQLTNNLDALSPIVESPDRNPTWSEVETNGASCLAVDLAEEMNTEIEQN